VNEDADDEVDGYEEDADNLDVIGGDDGVVEGDGVSDKKGDE
jgi:hypothetical protein